MKCYGNKFSSDQNNYKYIGRIIVLFVVGRADLFAIEILTDGVAQRGQSFANKFYAHLSSGAPGLKTSTSLGLTAYMQNNISSSVLLFPTYNVEI